MDTNKHNILSEIDQLSVADLFMRGESLEKVQKMYPGFESDVGQIFADTKIMSTSDVDIPAPKSVLVRTLNMLPDTVTVGGEERYTGRRVSFINQIIDGMSNLKLGLSLAALVLIIGGGIVLTHDRAPELAMKEATPESGEFASRMAADSASGELTASDLDVLSGESAEELAVVNESDADIALATTDRDAMNDYATTYSSDEI